MTRPTDPPEAPERVQIRCADGRVLQGHFLQAGPGPGADGVAAHPPVLLCPATGVRQHFYLRFAAWLAAQGRDVLVFDYRGIGLSRDGPLRADRASLVDWGCQDLTAALDHLLARTGAAQAILVGHSAGGQMLGLMHNHARVARLVGVAASTGWFRSMRPAFRRRARLGLQLLLPLGTLLRGYAPASRLGLGEDLPAAVARQWAQWCAAGGYARNAVGLPGVQDFHAQVRTPITVLRATDDDIANPGSVADLLSGFPAAPRRAHAVAPADLGLPALGHIDWFRSSHQAAWPRLLAAIDGRD